jgi:hypothetical protein
MLEVPGVKKRDVQVHLGRCPYTRVRQLTVSGCSQPPFTADVVEGSQVFSVRERRFGEFSRCVIYLLCCLRSGPGVRRICQNADTFFFCSFSLCSKNSYPATGNKGSLRWLDQINLLNWVDIFLNRKKTFLPPARMVLLSSRCPSDLQPNQKSRPKSLSGKALLDLNAYAQYVFVVMLSFLLYSYRTSALYACVKLIITAFQPAPSKANPRVWTLPFFGLRLTKSPMFLFAILA